MFAKDLLAGQTALVTGASSGLGRHFAAVLAAHGARVVLGARRMPELQSAVTGLRSDGAEAHAVALDVRDPAAVDAGVAEALRIAGAIDILVNNSGVADTRPALATQEEEWQRVLDTNLSGAFRVTRAVGRAMKARGAGGAILNVTSIVGARAAKQLAAYAASKAGLARLTEVLALELAAHRIRVNALAPGYVETDLNREFLQSESGAAMARRVPLRRFGVPADLDGALLLLVSRAGAHMTGTTVTVDGGHSLAWL